MSWTEVEQSGVEEAARAWRARLPPAWRRATNGRGLMAVGVSGSAYLLLAAGTFLLPWGWLRLLCGLLTAVGIGALFVTGHDAGHGSLVRTGWLNRLLGRLVMLPAYHPFTSWVHAHNTLHHGWTGLKGRQPDFA